MLGVFFTSHPNRSLEFLMNLDSLAFLVYSIALHLGLADKAVADLLSTKNVFFNFKN